MQDMSLPFDELKGMSDDQLRERYDSLVRDSWVDQRFYLQELDRRSRERSVAASDRLARASFRLGVVTTVASVIAVVVSTVALLLH